MRKETKTNSRIRSQENTGKVFESATLSEISLKAYSIVEISESVLEVGSAGEKEIEIIHDFAVDIIHELNSSSIQTVLITETNEEADAINIGSKENAKLSLGIDNYTSVGEVNQPNHSVYQNLIIRFVRSSNKKLRSILFSNKGDK